MPPVTMTNHHRPFDNLSHGSRAAVAIISELLDLPDGDVAPSDSFTAADNIVAAKDYTLTSY